MNPYSQKAIGKDFVFLLEYLGFDYTKTPKVSPVIGSDTYYVNTGGERWDGFEEFVISHIPSTTTAPAHTLIYTDVATFSPSGFFNFARTDYNYRLATYFCSKQPTKYHIK